MILFADELFNECEELGNNGGCQQICIDQIKGHRCECKPGYILNPDKRTCKGESLRSLAIIKNSRLITFLFELG